MDSKSPFDTLEMILRLYENYLIQKQGRHISQVSYELNDVLKFVDTLFDLSLMIFNEKAAGYTCHGKSWIKGMLHVYLRQLAAA